MSKNRRSTQSNTVRKPLTPLNLTVLLVASLLVWWWGGGLSRPAGNTTADNSRPPPTQASAVDVDATAPAQAFAVTTTPAAATLQAVNAPSRSGLPTVLANQLPAEAQTTLARIEAGGPFPFAKDGAIFQNRERLLPDQKPGYYREYTVITPGEDDRGARRIVAGADGEFYYTADHYASFREVVR